MKKEYSKPELEIRKFEPLSDILLNSAAAGGIEPNPDWETWI